MTFLQMVRTGGIPSSYGKQGVCPDNEKLPSWSELQRIMDEGRQDDRVDIDFSKLRRGN